MPRCLLPSRSLAVVLLVGAWAACASAPAPPPPPPPPPAPVPRLADADIDAIADLLRLEDRREYDEAALRAALEHPNPEVRRRAALAIGRIGGRRSTPLLLQALADTSALVRAGAAFALGESGDSSAAVVRALAALAHRAGAPAPFAVPPGDARPAAPPANAEQGRAAASAPADPEPSDSATAVAVEAVAALGKLRSVQARDEVEALLRSVLAAGGPGAGRLPDPVVAEALLAIWRLPRSTGFASLIEPFTASGVGQELRWRAVYALMRAGDPRGADALLAALRDPDPLVRSLAARGLRAPVADSAGRRDAARSGLLRALDDEHPHVRINALRALATFGDQALAPAVARLLGDADPNVVLAAAEALGSLGGAYAAALLEPIALDPAARLPLRAAALTALVRSDPARGAAAAETLAASDDWLVRLYAARALGAGRWAHAETLLRRLAADPDSRVQAAALGSVASLAADTIPGVRALYIQGLASPDPVARAAALRGLARRADPGDLPLIMEAYAVAQRDSLNDAALAAVEALGALAARGVPVARSFFLRFSRPEDPLVRAAVAQRLDDRPWGSAWPAETGRPQDFYRAVVRDLVAPDIEEGVRPRVRVHTAGGSFTIELFPAAAPLTVHNFLSLARRGFFDGGRWHRVVPNFVLQGGDPRGDGEGGPGFAIRDEINRTRYLRGTLGMALSGPDTGGSQFFITHSPQPHLDGGHTAFGRVVAGLEIADAIVQDDPIVSIEVLP